MPASTLDQMSRHERAVLRSLSLDTRVTDLEDADDETQNGLQDLTKAVNRLTWAIGSAMFTLICVLVTVALTR